MRDCKASLRAEAVPSPPSLSTRILTGEEAPRRHALRSLGYGSCSASKNAAFGCPCSLHVHTIKG